MGCKPGTLVNYNLSVSLSQNTQQNSFKLKKLAKGVNYLDLYFKKKHKQIFEYINSNLSKKCSLNLEKLTKSGLRSFRDKSDLVNQEKCFKKTVFDLIFMMSRKQSVSNSRRISKKDNILFRTDFSCIQSELFNTHNHLQFQIEKQKYENSYNGGGKYNLGKYMIDKTQKIGKGAYSTVYLAEDSKGSVYAVKYIYKNSLSNKLPLVNNEVNILKKIKSNCECNFIVKVLDIYEDESCIYIIMEKMPQSLLTLINTKKLENNPYLIWIIIITIIHMIDYCHNKARIAHSDLHPKNILADVSQYSFKLCDFGLSVKEEECMKDSYESCGEIARVFRGFLLPPEILEEYTEVLNLSSNNLSNTSYLCNNPERKLSYSYTFEGRKAIDIWMFGVTIYWIVFGNIECFEEKKNNKYV